MQKTICPACKNEVFFGTKLCDLCKFPFTGSEKEKSIHIGRFISKKGIIFDADDSIKKSQHLLLAAAGFYLLGVIINFSSLLNSTIALSINIGVIVVILACAIFIKKQPILFLLIPLIVLLTIYISNYLIDSRTLINGILFKVLILGSLIYSIYNYLASEKFKKKYNI